MEIYSTLGLVKLKEELDKLDPSSQRYVLDMQEIIRRHFQGRDDDEIFEILDDVAQNNSGLPIQTYHKDLLKALAK